MLRRAIASLMAFSVVSLFAAHSARADGLIVISDPPPSTVVRGHFSFAPLEVAYHRVACDIKDQVAVTSVDQEFYNPNNARLEGDYIFPVPEGAQINNFSMDIDGKMISAELLPADKARDIYNAIVRKSKDPALLEYAGRAMFRVHIFPIEPNSRKRIQLKYTELLKQTDGLLDYHYTLNTEKYSSKPLQNLSVKINISSTEPITTLYSPTHEVDTVRHDDKNTATVGFEGKNIRPDTDFHLYIGHKAAPVGINLLTYRPDANKEGYFVLLASPTVSKDVKPLPKDVVFVMDTSGSMAGEKIEQARKALKYCIDTLNPQDRFEIVRFSTEAEPLFNSLKEANDDNRKQANDFAAGLKAAGGTAIDEALAKALEERPGKEEGRVFDIVFMTDGEPTVGYTNPDDILKHLKDGAKGAPIRIFSFGVGTDVNAKLLDQIADQSRGFSQYVLPNERLEVSMSTFWGKVQDPVIANLKIDSGDIHLTNMYPNEMPDLFKGDQLVAFGTYTKAGKGAITLTGMVNGSQQKFAQDVTFEEKTDSSRDWIAKLWATRRVGYLLDQIRMHGESKEVKDEVVELARRFGVVTPYTAMLIIEDEQRRGVPLAEQSMREMEFDKAAANSSEALRRIGEATGSQGVANAINTAGLRDAKTLDTADKVAGQSSDRYKFDGADGSSLAKGPDAPSAVGASAGPVYYQGNRGGGGAGGGGGGRGGRASGGAGGGAGGAGFGGGGVPPTAATTRPVTRAELNLGSAAQNGWQTAAKDQEQAGYRNITNYSQQTRVINNRSFFLNGNQWTDANVQQMKPDTRHVKVVFNSNDYFDLLAKHPDAAQYLSLGSNVTIELGGVVYDIVEEESVPAPK